MLDSHLIDVKAELLLKDLQQTKNMAINFCNNSALTSIKLECCIYSVTLNKYPYGSIIALLETPF